MSVLNRLLLVCLTALSGCRTVAYVQPTVPCPFKDPSEFEVRRATVPIDSSLGHGSTLEVVIRDRSESERVLAWQVLLSGAGLQRSTGSSESTVHRSELNSLLPGKYSLLARAIGYRRLQDSIAIRAGYIDTLNIRMGRDCLVLEQ